MDQKKRYYLYPPTKMLLQLMLPISSIVNNMSLKQSKANDKCYKNNFIQFFHKIILYLCEEGTQLIERIPSYDTAANIQGSAADHAQE